MCDMTTSLCLTATTHDQEVFSFHSDHSPCYGFEEVLAIYKNIVPNLRLSGKLHCLFYIISFLQVFLGKLKLKLSFIHWERVTTHS